MNFETILNILKGIDWKPIICNIYKSYGRPMLKAYVKGTEWTLDDSGYNIVDKLICCDICNDCDAVDPIVISVE